MSPVLPLGIKELPPAPRLRRLIGPSFIILGLGLGSGEIIMWPYLTSNYGLGLVWGILIGITMQFFINMEVERYALVHGESIFVGFARMLRWLPLWFILSTFLGFGWPGIGLAGATLLSQALSIPHVRLVGVVVFIAIGLILSLGKVLYKTVERIQKVLIGIGVPLIFLLTFSLADFSDVRALAAGLIGQGEGFQFLPAGIAMATFLGAIAYAGAGGNLNLAQSCYVRDKGYGMGAYADKITSLFTAKEARRQFSLTGNTFELTEKNLRRFHQWWRTMNLEHLIIFWGLGLLTMLTLALLAYATSYGIAGNAEGIRFVIHEASAIAERTLPMFGTLFLLVTGVMLSATLLTVLDSTSRIITENMLLLTGSTSLNVSRAYYAVLWTQILAGIAIFMVGFDQPLRLIVTGAVINAFSMCIYTGLILWLNNRCIASALRPRAWRNIVMAATLLFLGVFCFLTLAAL